MEKENIVKAISNPDLARRAAAALKKTDPGPLELVHTESDSTLGYDATCCRYLRYRLRFWRRQYWVRHDVGDVHGGAVFGLSGQAG